MLSASISFSSTPTGSSNSSSSGMCQWLSAVSGQLRCVRTAARSLAKSTDPTPQSCSTSSTSRSDGLTRWATSARTRSGPSLPLTSSTSETRRSPRCRRQQLGERLERRCGVSGACQVNRHLARRPLHRAPRSAAARSRPAGRLLVFLELAAHEQHRVGSIEDAVLARTSPGTPRPRRCRRRRRA